MAIDTKTTAGGVVLLLLSGSGSYLATNAVNGETTAPTTSLEREEEKSARTGENPPSTSAPEEQETNTQRNDVSNPTIERSQNENQLTTTDGVAPQQEQAEIVSSEDQGRSVATGQGTDEKVATVASDKGTTETITPTIKQEITEAQFGDIDSEEETDCKGALSKSYTDENFKEAIKVCFKTKTFKERATQLSIQLIVSDSQNSSFNERRTSIGDDTLLQLAKDTAAKDIQTQDGKVIPNTLPDFCDKVGKLTWSSINSATYPIDKEWSGYLKGCATDATLTTNFWTGK